MYMQIEQAYSDMLTLVACGEDKGIASDMLFEKFPALSIEDMTNIQRDALRDALKQGVEREDVDPSWF